MSTNFFQTFVTEETAKVRTAAGVRRTGLFSGSCLAGVQGVNRRRSAPDHLSQPPACRVTLRLGWWPYRRVPDPWRSNRSNSGLILVRRPLSLYPCPPKAARQFQSLGDRGTPRAAGRAVHRVWAAEHAIPNPLGV